MALRGRSRLTSRRLCSRAPPTIRRSDPPIRLRDVDPQRTTTYQPGPTNGYPKIVLRGRHGGSGHGGSNGLSNIRPIPSATLAVASDTFPTPTRTGHVPAKSGQAG